MLQALSLLLDLEYSSPKQTTNPLCRWLRFELESSLSLVDDDKDLGRPGGTLDRSRVVYLASLRTNSSHKTYGNNNKINAF